jgi:hypothetical protein
MSFASAFQDAIGHVINIFSPSDAPGSEPCNDTNIEPSMISEYQCLVHKEHYTDDPNMSLPEFVAGKNSQFGVTSNDLKTRMPCCDNPNVLAALNDTINGTESTRFPPYCCRTSNSTCPSDNQPNASFTYANAGSDAAFNGVCYATGTQVKSVIKPLLRTPPPPPNSPPDLLQTKIVVLVSIVIVCILLYMNIKSRFERQKRTRVMRKLVRGLEGIDEVV